MFKISKNTQDLSYDSIRELIKFSIELLHLTQKIDEINDYLSKDCDVYEFFMNYIVNKAYNTDLERYLNDNVDTKLVENIFRETVKYVVNNVKALGVSISNIPYDQSRDSFMKVMEVMELS